MGFSLSPQRILITGGAGFIGQELTAALLGSSQDIQLTITDVTEPTIPKSVIEGASRVTTIKANLTDPAVVSDLLTPNYSAVYLLHGLMSGGAEANLELGWSVNWDSHRLIVDYLRRNHPGTVVVFPSSLAVYGPPQKIDGKSAIISETTCPQPQSSYGAQKLMMETYLSDMSRRGLLDGRVVRLPTIIVRPGAPSAAASSFASGIVREPLKGKESILPTSRNLAMWICSPQTVVKNLVSMKDVPASKFGLNRVVNLPGITVTVQQILDALEVVGGKKALSLVKEERDPKIEAIVGSWPAEFDITLAKEFGLEMDVDLAQTVKAFHDKCIV